MEVVLQWLDELDDLVFAGFGLWLHLRRFFLWIAFSAAIAIHLMPRLGIGTDAVLTLLSVSLLAISAWGIVSVLALRADRSARVTAGTA